MIDLKEPVRDVFKKDLLFYLFDRNRKKVNQLIVFPPVFLAIPMLYFGVLIYRKIFSLPFALGVLLILSLIWFSVICIQKRKKLREKECSEKEFKRRIILYNYEDAIEEGIFLGDKHDIEIINDILPLYEEDKDRFRNRYIHNATIITIVCATSGFIFSEMFGGAIRAYFDKIPSTHFVGLSLLIIIPLILLVFVYFIAVNVYYSLEKHNMYVSEKLIFLRTELKKKYLYSK